MTAILWLGETCSCRAARVAVGEMLKVRGSMSAKTGVAPQRRMELTEAKKVKGVVTTTSPGPMSRAAIASQRASVPLAQPTANGTPQAAAAAFSKLATSGPRINLCESQTCAIAAMSSYSWTLCAIRRMVDSLVRRAAVLTLNVKLRRVDHHSGTAQKEIGHM